MTEQTLSALTDPDANGPFVIVDDEEDEEPGMTPEEIDEFLSKPVEALTE